ncbi:flavodoxin family protein [Methanopyrus sp.]
MIAQVIASTTDAPLVEILSGNERMDAEIVFLGTPVHAFRPAEPVRNFVLNNDWSDVKVALFCTYSLHPGKTIRWMRERIERSGGEVIGELTVKGEHPFLPVIARGRPDERDVQKARKFAEKVLRKARG